MALSKFNDQKKAALALSIINDPVAVGVLINALDDKRTEQVRTVSLYRTVLASAVGNTCSALLSLFCLSRVLK